MTRHASTPMPDRAAETHATLCKLPVFRSVALKVLKLTSDEDASITEISELLEADPGLSAEIVALANSPLCGCRGQIQSVRRAIAQLGLERTKSLTVTAALGSFARTGHDAPAMKRAWRHSFSSAVLAEELAGPFGIDRNAAYTAGLLHDIGRLGLLSAYPALYGALVDASYDTSGDMLEAERRSLGVDHCQAGMLLSRTWGFPEELQKVAGGHHQAAAGVMHNLGSLVRSACLMANVLGLGTAVVGGLPKTEAVVAEFPNTRHRWTGVEPEEIQAWIAGRLVSFDLG